MTQFEQAMQDVKDGKLKIPTVSMGENNIDYFGYQLATHKYQLRILAAGMTMRGVTLRPLKNYYGLKSRSAKDCLTEFLVIVENYEKTILHL